VANTTLQNIAMANISNDKVKTSFLLLFFIILNPC